MSYYTKEGHNMSIFDIVVFITMVIVFLSVGIYYGIKDRFLRKKKKSDRDFLTAASSHGIISSSLSLFTSQLSTLTLIRLPTATFYYGPQFMICGLHFVLAIVVANYLAVPVFMKNGLNTSLEYLEKRFGKKIFYAVLIFTAIETILTTAMWMSIPVHSMSSLGKIPFIWSLIIASFIAIFYAALGGMRAIILVNMIHLFIITFTNLSVVVKGTVTLGGIDKSTTWTIIIGFWIFGVTGYSTNQTVLQHYLPASKISNAQKILWLQIPLMSIFYFLCCFLGLVMYSFYLGCDPFLVNRVTRADDIVGIFVGDIAGHIPGFLGLFLVSFLSGALSSTAGSLNGLTDILHEHFIRKVKILDRKTSKLSPGVITILLGLCTLPFTIGTLMINDKLQGWIISPVTISNTFRCPSFGIFLLGLLNPRSKSTGAMIGLLSGSIVGIYLLISHFLYFNDLSPAGATIDNCPEYYCYVKGGDNDQGCLNGNYSNISPITAPTPTAASFQDASSLHKLSYSMGGLVTILVTFIIGSLISLCETQSAEEKKKNAKYLISCLAPKSSKEDISTAAKDNLSSKHI